MCDRNNLHILGSNRSGTQILSAWVWKPYGENLNATASQQNPQVKSEKSHIV